MFDSIIVRNCLFKKRQSLHKKRNKGHAVPAVSSGPTNEIDVNQPLFFDLKPKCINEFEWTKGHRLSSILELEEESRRDTPHSNLHKENKSLRLESTGNRTPRGQLPLLDRDQTTLSGHLKLLPTSPRTSRASPSRKERIEEATTVEMPERGEMREVIELPRAFEMPSRNLAEISRIDASLVFAHFTTDDAWTLGSALRNRLMPIPTPVAINISLANQNQTLFHSCTHSGVMPDNDNWIARKRMTVLRWGTSTWYMHCKFNGDERAFGEKYGLGGDVKTYAIHGGGIPIRVAGVEGVVAVVVVSGLKQHEDHAVVVEVIRRLYY